MPTSVPPMLVEMKVSKDDIIVVDVDVVEVDLDVNLEDDIVVVLTDVYICCFC